MNIVFVSLSLCLYLCSTKTNQHRGILSLVSTSGAPAFQSKLKKLVMAGTCVTDKSLDLLARHLASLKHLDVSGSKVTEGGIIKFSERRPNCQLKSEALVEEQASDGVVKDRGGENFAEGDGEAALL